MCGGEHDPFLQALTTREAPLNAHEAEDMELEAALSNIWEIAQTHKLDPFPTHFEVVPPHIMSELAAYSGLAGRFSHWTHGREYRQVKTMYDYGLSKIYELVINSNPSQAFLLENNPPVENKFIMAHVLGHTDFFKNNLLFAPTRRDMPEAAARNAARIKQYEDQEGPLVVEQMLDAALAIDEHIDPYLPHRPSKEEELSAWREQAIHARKAQEWPTSEFDDLFDSPSTPDKTDDKVIETVPPKPDRDLLGFMRNHAPHLEDWQRDILDIVRSESIYFHPQRRTKIMNEGWASYWHKRIMREMGDRNLITDAENETWWKLHSSVVAPSQSLNPYYLGMMMYEYLEDYYNGNLTEKENAWLQEEGIPIQPHYEGPLKDSPATPMLRDVMIHNDDQSFIRNHFDKNVADRMGMYIYEEVKMHDGGTKKVVKETGWREIRDAITAQMNNSGLPLITVVNSDYNQANELHLRHEFEGKMLDPSYIEKTLPYIHKLWQRPVHLETINSKSKKKLFYSYNGDKTSVIESAL
jgi:stage V sporulation protein R